MARYSNFDLRNFIAEGKKSKEENVEESAPGFEHDCAAHVVHETYGYGVCIEGKHTLVENENGGHKVTHYDVFFKSGKTVESVPVNELKVLTSESHTHGKSKKKNEQAIGEENVNEGLKDMLLKAIDKLFGLDKFNECMEAGWDSSEECKKIKLDMGYSAGVKSGFEKQAGTSHLEEDGTINEMGADAIELLMGVLGSAGLIGASIGIGEFQEKAREGKYGPKIQRLVQALEKKAGQVQRATGNTHEQVSKITKEEAFKKQIKNILDS